MEGGADAADGDGFRETDAVEEDEEENIANVFDIRDFTCVSPLEILSRELELIIRKCQGHFLSEGSATQ